MLQHDALLRVTSTAICGSDLHLFGGYMPGMKCLASGVLFGGTWFAAAAVSMPVFHCDNEVNMHCDSLCPVLLTCQLFFFTCSVFIQPTPSATSLAFTDPCSQACNQLL